MSSARPPNHAQLVPVQRFIEMFKAKLTPELHSTWDRIHIEITKDANVVIVPAQARQPKPRQHKRFQLEIGSEVRNGKNCPVYGVLEKPDNLHESKVTIEMLAFELHSDAGVVEKEVAQPTLAALGSAKLNEPFRSCFDPKIEAALVKENLFRALVLYGIAATQGMVATFKQNTWQTWFTKALRGLQQTDLYNPNPEHNPPSDAISSQSSQGTERQEMGSAMEDNDAMDLDDEVPSNAEAFTVADDPRGTKRKACTQGGRSSEPSTPTPVSGPSRRFKGKGRAQKPDPGTMGLMPPPPSQHNPAPPVRPELDESGTEDDELLLSAFRRTSYSQGHARAGPSRASSLLAPKDQGSYELRRSKAPVSLWNELVRQFGSSYAHLRDWLQAHVHDVSISKHDGSFPALTPGFHLMEYCIKIGHRIWGKDTHARAYLAQATVSTIGGQETAPYSHVIIFIDGYMEHAKAKNVQLIEPFASVASWEDRQAVWDQAIKTLVKGFFLAAQNEGLLEYVDLGTVEEFCEPGFTDRLKIVLRKIVTGNRDQNLDPDVPARQSGGRR